MKEISGPYSQSMGFSASKMSTDWHNQELDPRTSYYKNDFFFMSDCSSRKVKREMDCSDESVGRGVMGKARVKDGESKERYSVSRGSGWVAGGDRHYFQSIKRDLLLENLDTVPFISFMNLNQVFLFSFQEGRYEMEKEFPAIGIAPFDPYHNSSFTVAGKSFIYIF